MGLVSRFERTRTPYRMGFCEGLSVSERHGLEYVHPEKPNHRPVVCSSSYFYYRYYLSMDSRAASDNSAA